MRRSIFLLIVICALLTATSSATIHYVQHGQGNVPPYLTWQTAADSIQSAINVCSPGDTVLVANGIYPENLVINNVLIYLLGSSMDSTIIDGTGLSDSTIFFNNSNSTIENFNILGRGLGSYCYGIAYQNFPLEVKNCRIKNVGYGFASIGADVTADNILILNPTVTGFGLFGNGNNIISNSIVITNNSNSNAIDIGFAPDGNYFIHNNIIIYTGQTDTYEGIKVGAAKKVYIYNNLISRFSENIFFDIVVDTAIIKNNVLMYQDVAGSSASIWTSGNKVYVNNVILSKNRRGIYQSGGGFVISDYNLYWKNIVENLHGLSYGDSDMVRDPMFVKDTIPTANGNYDFHLQAHSPGIDKGDPNIKDVDGTRSDIGMYGGPLGTSYKYQDLPPRPPVNLSAVVDTNRVHLKWNKNTEADTAYYRVYRDTVINFTIDSTKIIGTPADTFFTDVISRGTTHLYYKITAVDKQGNQSDPSDEVSVAITAIKNYPFVINDYKLYQNYPNPFNPSTTIGYRLKESGYVKLMVYDILGRLVNVLVNKYQNAGYYEVNFTAGDRKPETGIKGLASGIYIYRIEVIGKGNIPVFTNMKKMILLK